MLIFFNFNIYNVCILQKGKNINKNCINKKWIIYIIIFISGIQHDGDRDTWDIMFQRFVTETDSAEKLNLMRGLAGIQSSWILNE